MKKRMNLISLCTGAAGFLLTAPLFAQMGGAAPVVPVSKAELISEQGTKQYIGRLGSTHSVTLRARVSGILLDTLCKEGDFVKEGDLVMRIEDTLYKAQLDSAEAKVKQIEAELEYARTNFNRQSELVGVVAKSDMDEANRLLKLCEAQLAGAKAALAEAKTNYSYTKIYSPISGRIGKTTYSPGNYLTPSSDALGTIVKVSPIYMKMAISEPDFINMFGSVESLKKDAVIRIRTADRKMFDETGYVKIADNQVDSSTGTLMLWCVFENKNMRLIPGGIVDAFISKKVREQFPAIRASAVMTGKNGQYVYVLSENNVATIRPVVPGELVGDMQVIREGLKEGERVIIDGTHKVMPGQTVSPAPVKRINPARDLDNAQNISSKTVKLTEPAPGKPPVPVKSVSEPVQK